MQPVALFLIRKRNDLDHIAPIIWKMTMVSEMHPRVWIVNPEFLDRDDFRLAYLREIGVTVEFCYRGTLRRLRSWVQKKTDRTISGMLKRLIDVQDHLGRVRESTVRTFLNRNNIRVVVVDWQKPDRYCIPQVLGAAKQVGVPIVAVPHGVPLQKSWLVTNRQAKRNSPPDFRYGSRFFDSIIAPHQHFKARLLKSGINDARVKVIGSPRYCAEWRRQLHKIDNAEGKLFETSLRKIVYFDHQRRYRLNQDVIRNGLIDLARNPSICLIVHSSPEASMWPHRDLLTQEGVVFDTQASARDLIAWSDVVVSTTSSLLLDAWLEHKLVVYPKHFHKVEMLFEDWNCCEIVRSNAELVEVASRDKSAGKKVDRNRNDRVDEFINFAVCGDKPNRDVLTEFVTAIETCADEYADGWNRAR